MMPCLWSSKLKTTKYSWCNVIGQRTIFVSKGSRTTHSDSTLLPKYLLISFAYRSSTGQNQNPVIINVSVQQNLHQTKPTKIKGSKKGKHHQTSLQHKIDKISEVTSTIICYPNKSFLTHT